MPILLQAERAEYRRLGWAFKANCDYTAKVEHEGETIFLRIIFDGQEKSRLYFRAVATHISLRFEDFTKRGLIAYVMPSLLRRWIGGTFDLSTISWKECAK